MKTEVPPSVWKMSPQEIDLKLMLQGAQTDYDVFGNDAWLWGRKDGIEVGFYFEREDEDSPFLLKEFIE